MSTRGSPEGQGAFIREAGLGAEHARARASFDHSGVGCRRNSFHEGSHFSQDSCQLAGMSCKA